MERLFLVRGQFLAVHGDVEDVDGFVSLGVDQHDVDGAAGFRDAAGEVVEQAGAVLGDDFDQRRGIRGLAVEADPRLNPAFLARWRSGAAVLQQVAGALPL